MNENRVSPPLPAAIRAEMRPYQTEGFHFLAYLASNRFGGVLADDMGLGKTCRPSPGWPGCAKQPSTLNPQHPAILVVCPKSVMDNWARRSRTFYPGLRVRLWRGEPSASFPPRAKPPTSSVINYTQLRSLSPEIAGAPWQAAILDEAQYIKNPDSKPRRPPVRSRPNIALPSPARPWKTACWICGASSALPCPACSATAPHFLRRYDSKDDPLARHRLSARVRPFLLRRTKAQVAKDLPDRVEEDLLCEMEGEQKTLYHAELKRARQLILGVKIDRATQPEPFNVLMSLLRLRQICCHPALVDATSRGRKREMSALEICSNRSWKRATRCWCFRSSSRCWTCCARP